MGALSNKKTWFSQLAKASPIVVRFRGEVQDSRYNLGSDDDTGYTYRMCWFDTQDDSPDGTYLVIESEDMANIINSLPKDRWIELEAGFDDGERHLEYRPVKASSSPSNGQTEQGQGSYTYPSTVDRYMACLTAARQVADEAGIVQEDNPQVYWEFVRNVATHFSMDYTRGDTAPRLMPAPDGPDIQEDTDSTSDLKDKISDLVEDISWDGTSHDDRDLQEMLQSISELRANPVSEERLQDAINWLETERQTQINNIGGEDDLPF